MRTTTTALAFLLTMTTAYVLYAEGVETRQLEQHVRDREQMRDRLADAISGLKATRAELSRPGRIEQAARALGMRPADRMNVVELGDVVATGSVGAAGSRVNDW